jgi:hypothetical protein
VASGIQKTRSVSLFGKRTMREQAAENEEYNKASCCGYDGVFSVY